MPTITDWIMVAVTVVYVIATILICMFNYRSAKATREQVEEQRRQFNETNRPCIDVTLEVIKSGLIALKVQNTGTRLAFNVNVSLNSEFIDCAENTENLRKLSESRYNLGINQSRFTFICSHLELKCFHSTLLTAIVTYSDKISEFAEKFVIDCSQYEGMLIYDSPLDDIREYQKKISEYQKKS